MKFSSFLELPVAIECDYSPYVPAIIDRPMEDCRPAEAEAIDVTSVKIYGLVEIVKFLSKAKIIEIEDKCRDNYLAQQEAQQEAEMEA